MKRQIFRTKILLIFTASLILLLSGQANADNSSLQYNLNVKFSGASPKGSAPWLKAVFNDNNVNNSNPNKVLLTMTASNLVLTEGIRMWCFNFTLNTSELTFSHVSGPKAVEIDKKGDYNAGGGGFFDFRFIFSDDEFNAGETSVYEISYTSQITSPDFSKISSRGARQGRYGSVALINDINGDDRLSGWIGDSGKGTTTESKSQ
jgi:hypothetical protein